jgi:hypothetical protein
MQIIAKGRQILFGKWPFEYWASLVIKCSTFKPLALRCLRIKMVAVIQKPVDELMTINRKSLEFQAYLTRIYKIFSMPRGRFITN